MTGFYQEHSYNGLVKIGIAGLGFMGVTHLGAFAKMAGVEVAAVCTQNAAALAGDLGSVGGNIERENMRFDFSKTAKYRHWSELVADPALDAVDICLPTDLHAEVTIAALTAGKHVLCEKPMALSEADCGRMMAAAEKHDKVLMIAQVLRFWPEYVALQEFGARKEYGAIRSATFVRQCGLPDWSKWLPVEARSGGAVVDMLIHDIDQALMLCGMPERVSAKKLGEVDGVTATLIYPQGPEVRIQGGWFAPGAPLSMTFQVRAERAELEFGRRGLTLSDAAGQRHQVEAAGGDGYEAEVRYFVECCRSGKRAERCLPEESARAVKVALLLKQSRAMGGEQVQC